MVPKKKQPVVTVNAVASPIIRGGGQILTGSFLVDGLLAFDVTLADRQIVWLAGAFTMAINVGQNLIEKWRNRKLIGPKV